MSWTSSVSSDNPSDYLLSPLEESNPHFLITEQMYLTVILKGHCTPPRIRTETEGILSPMPSSSWASGASELKDRIELSSHPYQGCVLNHYTIRALVDLTGLQPALCLRCYMKCASLLWFHSFSVHPQSYRAIFQITELTPQYLLFNCCFLHL